jgi:hypothetical protein
MLSRNAGRLSENLDTLKIPLRPIFRLDSDGGIRLALD